MQNINLVETLKLVKNLWTEIRHLEGILDGIGDFGRMENEILDSIFVQSLPLSYSAPPPRPLYLPVRISRLS